MLLFICMIQDIKRSRKDLAELSGDVRMLYILSRYMIWFRLTLDP